MEPVISDEQRQFAASLLVQGSLGSLFRRFQVHVCDVRRIRQLGVHKLIPHCQMLDRPIRKTDFHSRDHLREVVPEQRCLKVSVWYLFL